MRISDWSSDVCSSDLLCQRFEASAILSIETRKRRTVEVEHTEQFVATQQRHHDFRLRGRIAGNVAGERVDVADDLRLAQACRGTAHALDRKSVVEGQGV